MFIARISRGRSIRQFVAGVILVPSVVSLFWFAIFGGAAISQQREALAAQNVSPTELSERTADGTLGDVFNPDTWVYNPTPTGTSEAMTFAFLEHLPLSGLAAVIVIILVAIFFVSGADAASVVMGTLSQSGSIHPKKGGVVFWGVLTGAVAIVMLLVGTDGDALTGLRNITIIVAAPFALVMIGLCVSLWRDLRSDPLVLKENEMLKALRDSPDGATEVRRRIRLGRK
jgi:choline-glycine betaine transporter